ncbi:DUF6046 domain-containing protein [Tenacibaculum maritimum]|nr:DUF6046 domain-containing protein [Tenacibaculum maritimum]MDB0610454.1 DUF6046 domain-containing protein [Tenacibaculum maritimum]
MKFNQTDILFASLVGSKVAESIPRFSKLQNELGKRVLPPIPFLPLKNTDTIDTVTSNYTGDLWKADLPTPKEKQFFPLSFIGSDGVSYLLPYEPMISIQGKNTIIRRNVAKMKTNEGVLLGGSIKERWTQDDYEITITGVLIGSLLTGDVSECYPKDDFGSLKKYLTSAERIRVECEPLQLLGINYIVIEDFSFPFTKGENVQAYEIKAYSDFDYKLLLKIED